MSLNFNLEESLRDFHTQVYPTAEQSKINNASVLYKRKKYFLQELRHSLFYLGFVVLGIIYFRDISMLKFCIRAFSQFSLSNPYITPGVIPITDENKRVLTKFMLMGVLIGNSFCFLWHLAFGVYTKTAASDNYLHGGLSVQFIGERLPYSRFELLVLDLLVFAIQLIYHSLMCVTDDSQVLHVKMTGSDESDGIERSRPIESDGYNGDVFLLSINVVKNVKKVLKFSDRFENGGLAATASEVDQNIPTGMPGAYTVPPVSSFV